MEPTWFILGERHLEKAKYKMYSPGNIEET